jgi:lipopolysaccharide biosynthesis glycosyltransferase
VSPNVVAIATDGNFFPPAAFLATRLAALNTRSDTEIFLVSDSASDLAKAKEFGVPAQLEFVREPRLPTVVVNKRITPAAFLRFLLPHVVPSGVRRILYLDADVYPETADVFRLFDLDMGGQTVAGVRDLLAAYTPGEIATNELRIAGAGAKFLKSGVLLMDRVGMLRWHVGERVFDLAKETGVHDQFALNIVLRGEWLELSPAMNMTPATVNSPLGGAMKPVLTHFRGRSKPWHGPQFGDAHPVRAELESYLLASPWKSFLQASKAPEGARPRAELPPTTNFAEIKRYLRETRFADVEQGITPRPVIDPMAWPPDQS